MSKVKLYTSVSSALYHCEQLGDQLKRQVESIQNIEDTLTLLRIELCKDKDVISYIEDHQMPDDDIPF